MEYPEKEKQRNKRFLKTLGLSVSRNQSVLLVYMPLKFQINFQRIPKKDRIRKRKGEIVSKGDGLKYTFSFAATHQELVKNSY